MLSTFMLQMQGVCDITKVLNLMNLLCNNSNEKEGQKNGIL